MSRVSRKSDLSPSITKGSNNIDLGKNSGVDMGRKSEPSLTAGGIGITQEVTNVGGMSVSAGANIDITPVDFGININPSEGTVSVATGAEIPGGLLGISGGIEIDLNTGEVIGGSIGGEALGLGINVSNSKGKGLGIEFTVQIPGTPIELSLGFGFPPKEEPEPTSTPTPSPSPSPKWTPWEPKPGGGWITTNTNPGSAGKNSSGLPNPPQMPEPISFPEGEACGYNLYLNYDFFDNKTGEITLADSALSDRVVIKNQTGDVPPRGYSFGSPIYERVSYLNRDWVICYFPVNRSGGTTSRFFVGSWREDTHGLEVIYRTLSYENIYLCTNLKLPPPPPPPPPPFPNPPPRRIKKMDACCRENLKFLRAIYIKLGLARFPGQLPNTIIQEVPKEGEKPAEPPQVPIPDLVTLLNWQFERDDERWGQWQVQIDIQDADITEEGDQKKSIKLPNLAESMAEFEGQLLSIMANVDALVALQIKNLAESGMARQEAIKGYLASKAIIKYMAFKATEVDVPVPMTFTAGAETIAALLKESEGHIKGTDYVEKETLRDVYLDLLQAAAITRAVHWQRIDTKTDTKSQLLNILKGSVDLAASMVKPQSPNGDGSEKTFDPEKNFEDFIDSVEDGFRNTTGITDIQNPYGKPPSQRPRIRQIGDNISQAGGSD